jgi:hypothetical protein
VANSDIYTSDQLLTLGIATYAAVISTFVFAWDLCKWAMSGLKIDLEVAPNKVVVGYAGFDESQTYISMTASNVGDRPTTITNCGGMIFDSWWRAYVTRRNAFKAFVVLQPSVAQRVPYRLEVGAQWLGLLDQTDDLVRDAQNRYLFIILYTSDVGRGQRVRLVFPDRKND